MTTNMQNQHLTNTDARYTHNIQGRVRYPLGGEPCHPRSIPRTSILHKGCNPHNTSPEPNPNRSIGHRTWWNPRRRVSLCPSEPTAAIAPPPPQHVMPRYCTMHHRFVVRTASRAVLASPPGTYKPQASSNRAARQPPRNARCQARWRRRGSCRPPRRARP